MDAGALGARLGPDDAYRFAKGKEVVSSTGGVWSDPEFDADRPAAYYARVLEIPTPRWTAYEARRFGETLPDDVEMVTQERAYTSPIWYTPETD